MTTANESIDKVWKRYFKNPKNTDARDKLIINYLPLVKYISSRMAVRLPSHIEIDDLVSSGVIGLINALGNFDPKFKTKFETYAMIRIRGSIIDELRSLDWVPRSMREKFSTVQNAYRTLEQRLSRPATESEVAEHLEMEPGELNAILNNERYMTFISLNEVINVDEKGHKAIPIINSVPDVQQLSPFESAEKNEQKELLAGAIGKMPEQEKMVLILYYYEGLMLKEIGRVLEISESRVSQIHTKAISRLGAKMKKLMSRNRILNKLSLQM